MKGLDTNKFYFIISAMLLTVSVFSLFTFNKLKKVKLTDKYVDRSCTLMFILSIFSIILFFFSFKIVRSGK